VVRAEFVLADGSRRHGYLLAPIAAASAPSFTQPTIVVQGGHLPLWRGKQRPGPAQLYVAYRLLGNRKPEQVFPLRYRPLVKLTGPSLAGTAPGFLYREEGGVRHVR